MDTVWRHTTGPTPHSAHTRRVFNRSPIPLSAPLRLINVPPTCSPPTRRRNGVSEFGILRSLFIFTTGVSAPRPTDGSLFHSCAEYALLSGVPTGPRAPVKSHLVAGAMSGSAEPDQPISVDELTPEEASRIIHSHRKVRYGT